MRARFAALLVALAACASPEPGSLGVSRAAIIRGTPSDAARDAVVLLVHQDDKGGWGFTCTATLVAPNLLVTARHCVSVIDDHDVVCDGAGNQIAGAALGADRAASAFAVYVGRARPAEGASQPAARGKAIVHDEAKTLCGHDLAFVVLDRNLASPAPVPVRLDRPPTIGEPLVAVGYGRDENGKSPPLRMERAELPVRLVGPFEGSTTEPPVAPRDFVLGESFCQGDSGGPALAPRTNAVVGVATRVGKASPDPSGSDCVSRSESDRVYAFYTQLSPFAAVAERAFAAAGHEPLREAEEAADEGCRVSPRDASGRSLGCVAAAIFVLTVARRSRSRPRRDRSQG